jgi:hypothetical protein
MALATAAPISATKPPPIGGGNSQAITVTVPDDDFSADEQTLSSIEQRNR